MMVAPQSPDCPDENELVMSMHGLLTPNRRANLERHIDGCERCRALVATVVKASVDPGDDTVEDEQPGAAQLPRGTNLGRYVLLVGIGRGGMAVVYAAYDPELDRKVAIKLLRTDLPGTPDELRATLLREAQAMAKLTHPHVIAVYDVGTFNDQVFLAMEFIRGRDLRSWLGEAQRSWTEILAIFLKAGEGLSAAHDSGLVHRDFKPDNVLVGLEGQVRVTDFGLAYHRAPPGEENRPGARADEPYGGPLAGTPLYISPEQWRGLPADARSDQFSFCVSLYEALYAARPYSGKTSASYEGVVPPPPKGSAVPGWVRRVLLRGLSIEPNDRYASMAEILSALTRGLAARKYRTWIAVGVAAVLALAVSVEQAVQSSALRAVEADLSRSAELFRVKAAEQQGKFYSRADASLKKDFLPEALGRADDLDARLGLAADSEEQGIASGHELLRSADLPLLEDEDVLLFVDARGRLVYNRADEGTFGGGELIRLDIVDQALKGNPAETLWSAAQVARSPVLLASAIPDRDLLLLFARPITRGRKTLGALLFGRWVKESFLAELEQSVGDRLLIRAPDGAQVSITPEPEQALGQLDASPKPSLVQLGKQRLLVQSVDLVGISGGVLGRAFLLRDYDPQVQPIVWRFRRDAVKYGLLGIILPLAAFLAWRARSRRLSAAT